MALFDGGRFSSQFDPSLGSDGDSDLITNKKIKRLLKWD